MKRVISWLIVAAGGFGLMLFSYYGYQYEESATQWEDALMYVGKGDPNAEAEGLAYVKRPMRLLPLSPRARAFAEIARSFGSYVERSYRSQFREKVVLYSGMAGDFTDDTLEWGRLPLAGADEVVAGFHTNSKEKITIDGRAFKVVGRFKKEVRLFADSYLISDVTAAGKLFDTNDETVQNAYILPLPKKQLSDSEVRQRLVKAFPKSQFAVYAPIIRTEAGPFCLYVTGVSLLFVGGCLVLFNVYGLLAGRVGNKWLRSPLMEIGKYKRLFLSMHLIYFGTVVLFMVVAYLLPELQLSLLAGVKSQVVDGSGPLGVAGKAYMSKNILRAAVTTFAINFSLGSLACLTIPSIIIPGAGVLVAGFRAMLWGLLIAPSFVDLSGAMLPHSFTLLLEGEGYILATFFGLLIPVYLFRRAEGPRLVGRYGRALLMNVRGNLLVAIVLAVAAIYEAIEVILSML